MRIRNILLTAATAALLTACGQPMNNTASNGAVNSNANVNANAANSAAAAPTKEALFAIEKKGWEAWKLRDATSMGAVLSDRYTGFGPGGRTDKAGSLKSLEQKCEVKNYSFSDEKVDMVGPDVAVLTFKAAQDYSCDGKKGPAEVWSTGIYAREGNSWKSVYYSETPVVDPKAPAAANPSTAPAVNTDETKPDAATEALLAAEQKIWDAWQKKDASALEPALGSDYFWIAGNGRTNRADIVKTWTADNKCDVKSTTLSNAKSVSLAKDVSLITYRGAAAGTCEGKPIPTEWYAAVYSKTGDTWKPAVGVSVGP